MSDSVLKMTDLPPVIREMLCMHEVFRRLGFHPNEIKPFITTADTSVGVHMLVESQGKEFLCSVGEWNSSFEEFKKVWEFAAEAYNRVFTADDVHATLEQSQTYASIVGIVEAMANKGFTFPNVEIVDISEGSCETPEE